VAVCDLRANIVLLQQSARHDPSKSKKSTRGNTSKDGSNFEDSDYDAEHAGESMILLFPVKERALLKMMTVTKIQKLTLNIVGAKKCKIVATNTSKVALGDSFFNDIQSCSHIPLNLEDVTCFPFCSESYETCHTVFFSLFLRKNS